MAPEMRVRLVDINGRLVPFGIDTPQPIFHYQLSAAKQVGSVSAWQLIVADDQQVTVWNSGKTPADASAYITYQGAPLQAKTYYSAIIRVWDENDQASPYCEPLTFETGFGSEPWQASWIEPVQQDAVREKELPFHQLFMPNPEFWGGETRLQPCQNIRRDFECRSGIRKARAYVSAHGVYQLYLNGNPVGNCRLAPETSVYDKILYYQTYDLTELLRTGVNTLGLTLADGWWIGRLGISGESCNYGKRLGLILQLEIDYDDGGKQILISDSDFQSAESMIRYADLFIGEKHDLQQSDSNWSCPGYPARNWQSCQVRDYPTYELIAQPTDSIKVIEELPIQKRLITPSGELVFDFGQVIAGVCRFTVIGQAGQVITFEHGEVLGSDGSFRNNIIGRNKDQKDVLVCKMGTQVFEPLFTYHGFRYVRISGIDSANIDAIARVMGTPLQKSGSFSCSDPRLNQLQHAIEWSTLGNMVSIPTDCPQREKLGWTGDIQVFARTGCFNYDLKNFLETWLMNLRADQFANGEVPVVVPNHPSQDRLQRMLSGGMNSSAGWSDACVLLPYYLFQQYGDLRVLSDNFSAMEKWMAFVRQQAALEPADFAALSWERQAANPYLWTKGYHFGDWLIPSLRKQPDGVALGTQMTAAVVGACFYAITVEAFISVCQWLGNTEKAAEYETILQRIRQAIITEFVTPDGKIQDSDLQGLYVMVVRAGAVTGMLKQQVLQRLVDLIRNNDNCLDTGFSSVSYLLDVLYDNGFQDLAFKLLFQTQSPSWLYMIEQDATTIWENWQAITDKGEVTDSSYNHYAFGCVGDWIYRRIGGIQAIDPGYKTVRIAPDYSCGLSEVRCRMITPHGELVVDWQHKANQIQLNVTIPARTQAEIVLPEGINKVLSGTYQFSWSDL